MFKKPSSGKKTNLSQFGLIDVDLDVEDEPMDISDDDLDLEAELAAITGGAGKPKRPRKPAPVPAAALDAMIAESLKDVPSDDEGSGDDDDPDLLSELQELGLDDDESPPPPPRASRPAPAPPGQAVSQESSTVSLLQERISNYSEAEKKAKQNGESSRARRFGRGLKNLQDLLKQAKAGKPINDEDIPPAVSIGKADAPAATPLSPVTPPEINPTPPDLTPTESDTLSTPDAPEPMLPEPLAPEPVPPPVPPRSTSIPEEPSSPPPTFSPPAPPAEQGMSSARQQGLQIIMKRKEEFKAAALASKHAGDKSMALEYLKVVKQFDMVVEAYKAGEEMDLNELPTPDVIAAMIRSQEKAEEQTQNSTEEAGPSPPEQEPALITATTVAEALKQRLAAFQAQESKAKEEGNSSKARRMGRIVKQYQEAIRTHAAGRPIAVDELPTPAGHGPIPAEGGAAAARAPPSPPTAPRPAAPRPAPPPARPASTRYDKQIAFLLQRQKEFKDAALKAKRTGNIEQAKEYLRAAKGFDSVIEAAKGGLTVDLKSLPLPPTDKKQIEKTFDIISAEDCSPPDEPQPMSLEDDDVLTRLHQQLTSQLKLCLSNRDHYKAMGNVAESNRFEHMAVSVKQDLDVVTVAKRRGTPPRFHYESRQFSVVQCNTHLNENDLELTIVRGIAYNVPNPKEIDTYVKFEFPYPQEAPVSDRTSCIKDTNSPQYDATYTLPINRSARPCQRVFKRHAVKFEVYSRGGWFSRDTLVGSVAVKLEALQNHVTIHEAFPLMDGRRPAGGSLEIRLRVRTPLLQQHFETSTHKWLIIDN